MEWLREMVGLADTFTGVIEDTASTSTFTALLCARERISEFSQNRGGLQAEDAPLVVYASDQAHSSIPKGALLAGFGAEHLRLIATDDEHALRLDLLERAIEADLAAGFRPCAVVAAVGTTATTALDPVAGIAALCERHGLWLHVDAALAGTAMICPEYRWMWQGVDRADSVVFNPHKWMGTGFDLSAYYVRDPEHLVRVMSTDPSYLRTAQDGLVRNLRDWGIPLGRRFRALKLWFLLRSEGVEGLQRASVATWTTPPGSRSRWRRRRSGDSWRRRPSRPSACGTSRRRWPATRSRSRRTTPPSSGASRPTAGTTSARRCSRTGSSSASPSARSPPSASTSPASGPRCRRPPRPLTPGAAPRRVPPALARGGAVTVSTLPSPKRVSHHRREAPVAGRRLGAGLSSGQEAPSRADTRRVSMQGSDMVGDPTSPRTDTHREKRPRRATAAGAALLAVLLAALVVAAAAAPRAAAAPSLFDLQKEAKRTRAEMAGLQSELQSVGQKLAEAQQKLDAVNQRLIRSRIDLKRAENALDLQREILAKRAATLYKTGGLDWLDIISNIQSLSDLDTIRSMERAIAEQDRLSENEAQRLARQSRVLERQVEQDHTDAVAAAQEVQNQQIELDQKLAERTAILQDVTKRIKKILASGGLRAALAMAKNGQFTQFTWAQALLVTMRLPVTADNVAAITAWEMAEGGHWYNTAYYNPLNTTQDMPGATVFNSVGVKAYTSWKQGLEATVKTLKNGYYGGIIDALRRGNDASGVAQAVGNSPWGTGDFSRLL